jgi:hypothetical protein
MSFHLHAHVQLGLKHDPEILILNFLLLIYFDIEFEFIINNFLAHKELYFAILLYCPVQSMNMISFIP